MGSVNRHLSQRRTIEMYESQISALAESAEEQRHENRTRLARLEDRCDVLELAMRKLVIALDAAETTIAAQHARQRKLASILDTVVRSVAAPRWRDRRAAWKRLRQEFADD